MNKVSVDTESKSYPVLIGIDTIERLPNLLEKYDLPKRLFVIIDEKVQKLHDGLIRKIFSLFSGKVTIFSQHSSEKIKSFKTVQQIFSRLLEDKFARDTTLIAIGGGTIGDVSGFIASTYMRGVHIVQVPTTLLSAVDSSIGGKTAINFNYSKNLIGTIYQPSFVLVDLTFLKTLPKKEIISGIGEIIKYSYLSDENFYSELLKNKDQLLQKDLSYFEKVVYECVKIKAAIVSKDEKEISGLRKILNFGHTFAHALESNYNYKISHGKAVMFGIVSALHLSYIKGLIDKDMLTRMIELPLKFKAAINLQNFNEKEIFRLMSFDKKNTGEKIRFVLIRNFGELLVDIEADQKKVYNALNKTRKLLV